MKRMQKKKKFLQHAESVRDVAAMERRTRTGRPIGARKLCERAQDRPLRVKPPVTPLSRMPTSPPSPPDEPAK